MTGYQKHNLDMQRGFTLIEIILVLLILSMTTAVVVPVSYRLFDKFMDHLEQNNVHHEQKKSEFVSFVKDEASGVYEDHER